MAWEEPVNYRNRPVTVLGGGVLGRRIACIWASAGYHVRIRDTSSQQCLDAVAFVKENVASFAAKTGQTPGDISAFEDIHDAVADTWLVIEAITENLQLKIDAFAELDAIAPTDCIFASNSSSFKSSLLITNVSETRKPQILNMHFYMPPLSMIVELMTDGHTFPETITFLASRLTEAGAKPFIARKESTGFIFNRLWAAVKRETLTILAEGVATPQEIDEMWLETFAKGGSGPCIMMDHVGLDTVASIESHYAEERGLSSEKTVIFLEREYLGQGKLGVKSDKGGLYSAEQMKELVARHNSS